jgi:protein TonB
MPKRQRLAGLAAALLLEALVVLALLTLGSGRMAEMAKEGVPLKTFDLAAPSPEPVVAVTLPEPKTVEPRPVPKPEAAIEAADVPAPASPTPAPPAPAPAPQPSPLVKLSPAELAAADLRSLPSTAKPVARAGPPAPSTAADTPLVDGSGPNGEKLYAAAWQREPSDGEMRGYLSTAQPGWGMIACRTVADFKVDDCVAVGDSRGSQLVRAMLAAAWQFRVRPPRIGGRLQVGEWVRIRFDYRVRQRAAWEQNRD